MQFASMSLGIFDFLIKWLTNFLMWLVGWVIDILKTLFAALFYNIGHMIASVVDIIQAAFKRLAGMDTFWYPDENGVMQPVKDQDPIMQLLTNNSVKQVLIAISLIAVAIVIIAAIIQIVRSEFSTEAAKTGKGGIIASALKSLFMFMLVPLMCIGGVYISNRLLVALDTATSQGSSTLSSSVFVSSAYSCNRVRNGETLSSEALKAVGFNGSINQNNRAQVADYIDNAFRQNLSLMDRYETVDKYYVGKDINFIVYIGGGVIAAKTMLIACVGMIIRMFMIVILFILSPPVIGIAPLDGGTGFKNWTKIFVSNVFGAYGTIIGLNLLFLVLPVVSNIRIFNPGGSDQLGILSLSARQAGSANALIQMIVALTGLFLIKDVSSTIDNIFNWSDGPMSKAEGMAKKVASTAAAIGGAAIGGVGALAGAAGAVGGVAMRGAGKYMDALGFKKTGNTFKGLGNMMSTVGGIGGKMAKKGVDKIGNLAGFKGSITDRVGGKVSGLVKSTGAAMDARVENGTDSLLDKAFAPKLVKQRKLAKLDKKIAKVKNYDNEMYSEDMKDSIIENLNIKKAAIQNDIKGPVANSRFAANAKRSKRDTEALAAAEEGGSLDQMKQLAGGYAGMDRVLAALARGSKGEAQKELKNIKATLGDDPQFSALADYVQKITTLLSNTNGRDKNAVKAIAGRDDLKEARDNTRNASQSLNKYVSEFKLDTSSSAASINSQLKDFASQVAKITGEDVKKLEAKILNAQKQSIEKLEKAAKDNSSKK